MSYKQAGGEANTQGGRMGAWPLDRALSRGGILFGTFTLVAILKVSLVAIYGPIFVPDTSGYIAVAKEMLKSNAWLNDAQLSAGPFPSLAIRMIGYPAALAVAMQIAGPLWAYLIVALQFAMTMVVLWAIYALGIKLRLASGLALFAVVAFATSDQLVTDQCILTDSLNADLIILTVCILAYGALSERPLSLWRAAAAGALLIPAFLLREAMPFLATTMLPLVVVRCLHDWSGRAAIRAILACALVLLPLWGTAEIYKEWNRHRTGERFVTTSAQLTLMLAQLVAAKHDHQVFEGDTPLDRAARQTVRNYDFGDITPINRKLIEQGYRPTEIAQMSQAHYFATWLTRPWAMLHVLRDRTSEHAAKLAFHPLSASCELIEWATTIRQCPDYRDLLRAARSGFSREPFGQAIFFLLETWELTISIALFSAFVLGAPLLWVSSWWRDGWARAGRESVILALWAMYVGWFVLYALVNMESRYMNPVLPFSILGGLIVWQELARRVRLHRGWAHDPGERPVITT
jgi:hypothetical protein